MKKILLLLASIAIFGQTQAQLDDGCKALDWTVTDMNTNTSVNLYAMLDSGKYVFVDMFATWCGPCWTYHQGGELKTLLSTYGPGTATDDVRVVAIDVDGTTTDADMNGTTTGTAGNWLLNTTYPIANPATAAANTISDDYEIAYFPTIYMICPDRTIREVGQQTAANLYAQVSSANCPAKVLVDALPYTYGGEYISCDNQLDIEVDIKNRGWDNLTSATVNVLQGATTIATQNWTGNLTTYQTATVSFGKVACLPGSDSLTFEVIAMNDDITTNDIGTIRGVKAYPEGNTTNEIKMELKTDSYAMQENSWTLTDAAGTIVDQGAIGSVPNSTTYNKTWTLPASSCYKLAVSDTYGDGFNYQTTGYVKLMDANDDQLFYQGGNWTSAGTGIAQGPVSVIDVVFENDIKVYPNPAMDFVNVDFDLTKNTNVQLQLIDINGKIHFAKTINNASSVHEFINVQALANGIYTLQVKTANEVKNVKVSLMK